MDGLYEQNNILRVTRDPSLDKGSRGINVFLASSVDTPAAVLRCIQERQEEAAMSFARLMEFGRPPIEDVYKSPASFMVFQIDGRKALMDLEQDASVALERIPLLLGQMTSQFRNLVQFHNPSDPEIEGRSITQFLDRVENFSEPRFVDSRGFVMGGKKGLGYKAFDTRGNTPDLINGNEIVTMAKRFDFHDSPTKIKALLVELGYSFEDPSTYDSKAE